MSGRLALSPYEHTKRNRPQPLVAGRRSVVDEHCARHALRMERVCRAAIDAVWMEARRYVVGLYRRRDCVCPDVRRCGPDSGSLWTFLLFTGGRHLRQPGIFPVCLHDHIDLFDRVFRRDRWTWQWLRLRYSHTGYGEVVSGQARPGRGTRGRRLWRRIRDLRAASAIKADPRIRLTRNVSDTRRNLPCDDNRRSIPAQESACRLSPFRLDALGGREI